MLKRSFVVFFAFALTACKAAPAPEPSAVGPITPPKLPVKELWNVTLGIDAPESAYVDSKTGEVYVSLIGGMPDKKDGNGRIAKISHDGRTTNATWADGLNAPKGLKAWDNVLWTADIDEIVGFNMETGKLAKRVKVPDAKFLNDVTIGADGTVYVSDMLGNKIYALAGSKVSVFAEGEQLEYPNGLFFEGDHIVVGGWGSKPKDDFTTDVKGHLFKLDLSTKKKTLITPEPLANIDGVESDGAGGYIVSDYLAGTILRVAKDGKSKTLATFKPGTADIGFMWAGQRLIVPHMNENKVAAYDISGALQQ
jgi:DNA-binding beta-propeller fold protein YncE